MHRLSLAAVLAAAFLPSIRPHRQAPQALRSVFVEDYTWPELRDAIAAGATTVLIYAGSVEESGPHLVLGKHNLRARAYAERIARALDHTLVAPIIPAAPTGGALMRFPGTIDVRAATFAAYAADIARSLASAGFRYVVLAGDHGGDQAPLAALAPRLDRELAPRGIRVLFAGDGYAKASAEIEAVARSRHLRGSGHGGLWDTAELWAVMPSAVRVSLFAAGDTSGSGAVDARGVAGDPRSASPELGREFAEIRVRDAVAQIQAWRASLGAPQRRP